MDKILRGTIKLIHDQLEAPADDDEDEQGDGGLETSLAAMLKVIDAD